MQRFTSVILVLLGIIMLGYICFSSIAQDKSIPQAKLSAIEGTVFDFGRSLQHKELEHVFKLKNESKLPIRITGIRSSCGCTWAADSETLVGPDFAPGASFDFPVKMKTGELQHSATGRLLITYYPVMNGECKEPKNILELQVRTAIIQDYITEPANIDFGEINGLSSESQSRRFHVIPDAKSDIEVIEVKSLSPAFTAKLLPREKSSSSYEIEVDVEHSALKESGSLGGNILVTTNSTNVSKCIVRVQAEYHAAISVKPESIVISSDTEGMVVHEINVSTSCPSKIISVSSNHPEIELSEFKDDTPSCHHDFAIEIADNKRVVDTKLVINYELIPQNADKIVRKAFVPVYRFAKGGLK